VRSSTILLAAGLAAIAGFALADALRGENHGTPAVVESESTTTRREEPAYEGTLPPDLLTGRLVFTDENCDLGVVDLARAVVVRVRDVETNCTLSAPVRSRRIAYGFGQLRLGPLSYRVTDFSRPERTFGRLRAQPESIVWSHNGRRVAWCAEDDRGRELELGGRERRLAHCPVTYTRDGHPVYPVGGRLLTESHALVPPLPGRITAASIAGDGSVAVVLDGKRVLLLKRGEELVETRIPTRVRGVVPAFSPDNCGAIFLTPHRGQPPRVFVIDLGCLGGHERDLSGRRAAWSPDGLWFAVAEERTIAFYPVDASRPVLRLPDTANQLVWQR
jgi:hypothetical protein